MATINLGKVAPVYKGTYVVGTYQKYEVVFDGESSFISLVDNNVTALANDGTHWLYLCRGNANSALMKTAADDNEFMTTAAALANLEGRIKGLETFLKNAVFDTLQVDTLDVVENLNMYKESNTILKGTAAPASIPDFIGQRYIRTDTLVAWIACGNTNVSDWKQITN